MDRFYFIWITRIRLKGKRNPKKFKYPTGLDTKIRVLCTTAEPATLLHPNQLEIARASTFAARPARS